MINLSNKNISNKAASETLEDYTLRYAPHSFRRWSPSIVAITALGGIAYLADFSIGASIGLAYGTVNAVCSILLAALVIFLTGIPLAYYAARYNIDLDLITRGAGFGYYGSVITSLIFASFTFIFFALEGSVMAQGLLLGFGVPLWCGYLISTLTIIPLVIYGMKVLTKLQVWTTPIWLVLMVFPVGYLLINKPELINQFINFNGNGHQFFLSWPAIMVGMGICLALIMQTGEQMDYLRFMPAKTKENAKQWWIAVIAAGPGWVIWGALKQILGVFLGFYLIVKLHNMHATEPVQQFAAVFTDLFPVSVALILAVGLVILSQIKINVTNAYSGSLAWTSAYTRIAKHYPGRIIFVIVNLFIALALMEGNMFSVLNQILGLYSNFAIAWIVVVATDIAINKYIFKLSPKEPEYRKDLLYAFNPVGLIAFLIAVSLSILAFFCFFGTSLSSYSPLFALIAAFISTPLLGLLSRGIFYIRQNHDGVPEARYDCNGHPTATLYQCVACHEEYERPDIMYSEQHVGIICSLCKTIAK